MRFVFLFLALFLTACGSNNDSGIFDEPATLAIDSDNNRIFILEKNGVLTILRASDRADIGDVPFVDNKTLEDIHTLLPTSPTNVEALNIGSNTTRLFISGGQTSGSGTQVQNRILVLDFDGTNLEEASFSPIELDDGDSTTDDTDNVIGGLLVNPDNSRLYATDSSDGALYIFNTSTGEQAASPMAIAGIPNDMTLDEGRLYVANSTTTEANQLITVVNIDDLSSTTIDLDVPVDAISVETVSGGTVMLAKVSGVPRALIVEVDTTTYASATAIPAGTSGLDDGEINSGNGVSATIGDVQMIKDDAGNLYGYAAQSNGVITLINFPSTLANFTLDELETVTDVITDIDVLLFGDGSGSVIYMTAVSSGDLVFADVGSSDTSARF